MNCRYCGNVYVGEDRTCGGCGAPKNALHALLDAPATPDHWSNSVKDTVYRVLIGTVLVVVVTLLSGLVGINGFVGTLAFFWAVPVAPTVMTYAAWREAKGDVAGFLFRCFVLFVMWCMLAGTVMMAIGFATTFR